MFRVRFRYDMNPEPDLVYSVRKADDGTTEFLMYKHGGWYWFDADLCEPWEDEV